MKYLVTHHNGDQSPWLNSFENALELAKALNADDPKANADIVSDAVDVCDDPDCKSCDRDGLTDEQRELVWEHLR